MFPSTAASYLNASCSIPPLLVGQQQPPPSSDINLQFFKQTFQQPLQYGLAGFEPQHQHPVAARTLSVASTKLWPSDETYRSSSSTSSEGSLESETTVASFLPIRELQQLVDLENMISTMYQYECLMGHLQVLTIRYQGQVNEMFRNFITDAVLIRVGFTRTKNGKYECTFRNDFQRILKAIKSSWFPDKDQETFEIHMAQLLKNAHSRFRGKVRDDGDKQLRQLNPPKTCAEPAEQQQFIRTPLPIEPQYSSQPSAKPNPLAATNATNTTLQQLDQWYRYAIYYRDRYRIAKRANQRMKEDYMVQEQEYRHRISGCLKRVRAMRRDMDALEERLRGEAE